MFGGAPSATVSPDTFGGAKPLLNSNKMSDQDDGMFGGAKSSATAKEKSDPKAKFSSSKVSVELGLSVGDDDKKPQHSHTSNSIFGAKPSDPETVTRANPYSEAIAVVLDSLAIAIIGLVATIITLFAYSFCITFLPASFDLPTAIIILLCFIFFLLEMIFQIAAREGYLFSFFFWMDLLGTASLIFDLNSLSEWFWAEPVVINQVGADYLSRTTATLRVARLSRVVRVVRIVRVVRLLKILFATYGYGKEDIKKPSKFGNQLSLIMIQRLIVVVFLLVIIIPLLDTGSSETGLSKSEGLAALESVWTLLVNSNGTDVLLNSVFNSSYVAPPEFTSLISLERTLQTSFSSFNPGLLLLNMLGHGIVNNSYSSYRNHELGFWYTRNSQSFALFSLRDEAYLSAGYDLILTVCVIFIVLSTSAIIRTDVDAFVTKPIDRMTDIIKKLASTVCFLSEGDENKVANPDDDTETDIIENLLSNLAGAFNVGLGPTNNPSVSQKISRKSSLMKLNESTMYSPEDDTNPENISELSSMDAILNSDEVVPFFRSYMSSCLSVESLIYWQEVKRYRIVVESACKRLYSAFIENAAPQQVNIPINMVKKIEKSLENPTMTIFDESRNEIFNLLKTNNYYPFLESKFCASYLDDRRKRIAAARNGDDVTIPNSVSTS